MEPIPRGLSLAAQTCAVLRQLIVSGGFERTLPGEMELVRRLKVSRVTLRTALAQLEREGLLRGSKGRRREITVSAPGRVKPRACPSRVIILSPVSLTGLISSKLLWMDELRDILSAQGVALDFVVSTAAFLQRPGRVLHSLRAQYPDTVWLLLRSTVHMQRWFFEQRVPAVVAGSLFEGIELPGVDSDYFAACRHAAGRLIARGCRRLGLLTPQPMLAGDRESEAGFREGAGDIPVAVARHDGTPDGLCRVLDELMKSQPPHGLLVFHATHAATALTRLISTGWRLPRDLKLLSRDDDPFLHHLSPRPARYTVAPQPFARQLAKFVRAFLDAGLPPAEACRLLPEFTAGETL